jgi:hypothetical protein
MAPVRKPGREVRGQGSVAISCGEEGVQGRLTLPGLGVSPKYLIPLVDWLKGCRDLPAGAWGVPKIFLFSTRLVEEALWPLP